MSAKQQEALSQEAQDRIWQFFQQDDENVLSAAFPSRARFHFLARKVKKVGKAGNVRVLNIGIGSGYFERILSQMSIELYALDPIKEAVDRVEPYCVEAHQGYAHKIPFENNFFDIVIMSEVLEHIPASSLLKSLEEVQRVLKHGGRFMGTVPADEDLSQNMVVCPHCGHVFHRWGHQRSFSQEILTNLLRRFFDRVIVKRFHFVDWYRLNWRGKILAFFKIWQARLNIRGSSQTFYFEARKK